MEPIRLTVLVGAFAASAALPGAPAIAVDLHVPSRAYPTIQAGIDAAANDDVVIVAPGIYIETIDFGGKAITVTSTGGPLITTIDSQNTGTVVTFDDDEGLDSVLAGFTIRGAGAIVDFNADHGVLIDNASPTITSCIITGNVWSGFDDGGGGGIRITNGSPTITSTRFFANQVFNPTQGALGAALHSVDGSPTLSGCVFVENLASGDCAAFGGAVQIDGGSPSITRTRFVANLAASNVCVGTSSAHGGALSAIASTVTINGALFLGNRAEASSSEFFCGTGIGGAVSVGFGATVDVDASSFLGNEADSQFANCVGSGGALHNQSVLSVDGSYFCDNLPNDFGGTPPTGDDNELAGACPPPCAGDVDFDRTVGFNDLLAVLANWGNPGAADVHPYPTGDGSVGFDDLLDVLATWGPCRR